MKTRMSLRSSGLRVLPGLLRDRLARPIGAEGHAEGEGGEFLLSHRRQYCFKKSVLWIILAAAIDAGAPYFMTNN
jgi:hypothetical protein